MARWSRRSISFALVTAGATLLTVTSPITVCLCLAWDACKGQTQLRATRWMLLVVLIGLAELLGLTLAGLVWLLPVSKERFLDLNYKLQAVWTGTLFHSARSLLDFRLEVEGLDKIPERPFLLLVRHTSWADTVLAAALIANPRSLRLRYVLKRELLWGPCLDVVGQRLPNLFVDRSGRQRTRELTALRELAEDLRNGDGLLIYPEGTRFSADKLSRERARLEQQNPELLPIASQYRSVLPPRPGGVLTLLDKAPDLDLVLLVGNTGIPDQPFHSMPITDSNLFRSVIPVYADQASVHRRVRPGGESHVFLRVKVVYERYPRNTPSKIRRNQARPSSNRTGGGNFAQHG